MDEVKLDGLTAEEWAAEYFEYEDCGVCGLGKEYHIIVAFFGHWFAYCTTCRCNDEE